MKPEDLAKLTPEEKRIRIAELCDDWTEANTKAWLALREIKKQWDALPRRDSFSGLRLASEMEKAKSNRNYIGEPSDYLNDLNAMNEAIQVLSDSQREDFVAHLARIGGAWYFSGNHQNGSYVGMVEVEARDCFNIYNATAVQRADAFLLTLDAKPVS